MKNNNANLVGNGEGLKILVGNELSEKDYSNLQIVLEGVPVYLRKDYAGKIGYILSQDMSVEYGVERFSRILKEDGIDLAEGIPDGPNINTSCWFYGEKIVERLEKILEK